MPARSRETILVFVRHGESEGNVAKAFGGHSPTPLTQHGHAQARATANVLSRCKPDAIITSDLNRARQTAEYIRSATGVSLSETAALRERSLGHLDSMLFTDAQNRFPDDWARLIAHDPDWRCEGGGESTRDAFTRVAASVDTIVHDHAGSRVVIVSHAFAIFHAFLHILGKSPLDDNTRLFIHVGNCSLTTVAYLETSDTWRLDGINDHHHLSALTDVPAPLSTP